MNTGERTATTYGALDAFFPAVLALSGDLERAARLQAVVFEDVATTRHRAGRVQLPRRWKSSRRVIRCDLRSSSRLIIFITTRCWDHGVSSTDASKDPGSRTTRFASRQLASAASYRQQGELMFEDFVKHCRTEEGYAALKSVITKEKSDSMQSFLFAETFKYFYLLFAPPADPGLRQGDLQHRSPSDPANVVAPRRLEAVTCHRFGLGGLTVVLKLPVCDRAPRQVAPTKDGDRSPHRSKRIEIHESTRKLLERPAAFHSLLFCSRCSAASRPTTRTRRTDRQRPARS